MLYRLAHALINLSARISARNACVFHESVSAKSHKHPIFFGDPVRGKAILAVTHSDLTQP